MKISELPWHRTNIGIIVLMLVCFCEGFTQTKFADSLQLLIPRTVGIEKVDVLRDLAYGLVDVENECALMYARLAFDATDPDDTLRLVKAGRIKSLALRRQNFMDSSLDLSLKILPMARKISELDELKSILNGLGKVYTEQARYDKALENYWESLELSKRRQDTFDISVAMNNIGIVYYKLYDFDNAQKYFSDAIELRRRTERKYDFSSLLINAAITNANKKNFGEASCLIQEALDFCDKTCAKDILMQASFTSGFIAFHNKKYSLAKTMFLESLELAKEVGDERFFLDNIVYLSHINVSLGRFALAEEYLQLALERIRVAGTSYNREVMEVYMELAFVNEKLRNFGRVAFYQSQYIQLRDSLSSVELASSLMRIQAQHLEKENQIKLRAQDDLINLNTQIMLRQKYLNLTIGIVACLLLVLAIVLIRSNKHKERLNRLLDTKVRERTQALELNQTKLQKACEERDLILSRVVTEIKNSIATVKGLCFLAKKDSRDAIRYIDQVDYTSEKFLRIVETLNHRR